jgi:DNA invertase Pin-like site-specific DNA recombinase
MEKPKRKTKRTTKPKHQVQQNRSSFPTPTWHIELPLEDPCQIYPRVSTPEQMKNVSAEMQKDKAFATSCGWREDLIILDDRDLGVSGQTLMEDREAFNDMLRRIASGKIKAVVVVNVDRLFRDKWGAESGKFMEICHMYGVIIVTPDFVYDFRISWHIDRFKRRCEEAWNYLEYHVYGRLLPAREQRGYAGFWTGGNVPMGFTIDIRAKIDGVRNPTYQRYAIYEPHAEVIRWLFRRFKELNGNVNQLLSEVCKKPRLFPDFDETIDQDFARSAYSQYVKVEGGYTITTDTGLKYLLTNVKYIGKWMYKGEIIKLNIDNYPPAIVDLDDFTYAYNRLSPTKLDGTPNENIVEGRGKRYSKKHFANRPAILKEVIVTADPLMAVYAREYKTSKGVRYYYEFVGKDPRQQYRRLSGGTIVASGLDAIVLERMRQHMQQPESQMAYQDFLQAEDTVVSEESDTLKDIERDIAATKALIARTHEQIKSGKFTDPDLAEAANNSYIAAKQELNRLEKRKSETSQIANEDEERRNYKTLMREVEDAWEEVVMPEEHPRLVYLFIKSATLQLVSPNFFSITIEWKDPAWGVDTGLCYKGTAANVEWTEEEKTILKDNWLSATRKELLELLPRRNFQAMYKYIHDNGAEMGITTQRQNQREERVPYYACLKDLQVMQEYGITQAEFRKWRGTKLVTWYSSPLADRLSHIQTRSR